MTILPEDYFDDFRVYKDGDLWGTLYSKMYCGDTAMTARHCSSVILNIADELRAGATLTLAEADDRVESVLTSLDDFRAWMTARDRSAVFDQPRTDPYRLTASSGFTARYGSQLSDIRRYYVFTTPLLDAARELQNGAESLQIENTITGEIVWIVGVEGLLDWADQLDPQIGSVLREHLGAVES